MQAQIPELPPIQTDAVMALGKRARWFSWGYVLYVVYYLGIATLVAQHGVRFTGVGQVANDVVRLSNVFAPLFGYIVVNAALAASLRYFVPLHTAARWGTVAVAIVLALVAMSIYAFSVLHWVEEGRSFGSRSQIVGLGLVAGYAILAILVTGIARRLHRYVRIEDVWLPRYRTQ